MPFMVTGCYAQRPGVIREFLLILATLKAEKVFVREVDTLGVAYHSPALLPFAEDLRAGEGA